MKICLIIDYNFIYHLSKVREVKYAANELLHRESRAVPLPLFPSDTWLFVPIQTFEYYWKTDELFFPVICI